MVLLLILPLQDMMVTARSCGYSVAEVLSSFVDRIYGDSTSGEGEMNAGETYSSIDVGISEEKGILIYSLRSEPPTGTSQCSQATSPARLWVGLGRPGLL